MLRKHFGTASLVLALVAAAWPQLWPLVVTIALGSTAIVLGVLALRAGSQRSRAWAGIVIGSYAMAMAVYIAVTVSQINSTLERLGR